MKRTKTATLVECALLIAVASVLSIIKIAELPYGGSITIASMLPIVLISYRHGLGWGMGSGLAFAVVQQLMGLKSLSYVTTWQSVLAVILLDYIIAFAVCGLGGLFRGKMNTQSTELMTGALFVCILRYACHVISGATVWAGISIPTAAALAYSFVYNATYMLPETIVMLLVAYYLGAVIDFRREMPSRMVGERKNGVADLMIPVAGLVTVGALIADVALVFTRMQDPESGEFNLALLKVDQFAGSFWMAVVIVSAAAVVVSALLMVVRKRLLSK